MAHPCPRLWLKDEVVTPSRERDGDEDTRKTKTLRIWSPCLSTDISIKLLSQVPRVLLTSYLVQIFFFTLKDSNYFGKCSERPTKAGEDRSARVSLEFH